MTSEQKPFDKDATEETRDAVFKFGGTEPDADVSGEAREAQEPERPPAMIALPSPAPDVRTPRRPPSLFWPIILIGAGVLLLLSNLGVVPWSSWSLLWRLWPVLLIALGLDVLIGRRSMAGAIFSGVVLLVLLGGAVALVVFAQNIPIWADLSEPAAWQIKDVEHPIGDIERATVDIDWSSPPGHLYALSDSENLIEGRIAYRGELVFGAHTRGDRADVQLYSESAGPWFGPFQSLPDEDRRWDVRLSPGALLDLNLNAGSGRCDFDLSELRLSALTLDVGSGAVTLALPGNNTLGATIEGGSGALTISLPRSIGARVILESGSGAFRPGERFRLVSGEQDDDGMWETRNWDTAEHTVEITIDQGSGRVAIR
jgi:cell wall-active antibiotic response 4TMS protein YvqF